MRWYANKIAKRKVSLLPRILEDLFILSESEDFLYEMLEDSHFQTSVPELQNDVTDFGYAFKKFSLVIHATMISTSSL